jgi:transposase-like protein
LAKDKNSALKEFKAWKRAWIEKTPRAVYCLEQDLEELINFLDCPKEHRVKIRTTNVIERAFKEIRRRTRVFSCFSNRQSCERIIYAIFTHLNNQWKGKPLKEFTEFC